MLSQHYKVTSNDFDEGRVALSYESGPVSDLQALPLPCAKYSIFLDLYPDANSQ